MQAIVVSTPGDSSVLVLRNSVPKPAPSASQLLVKVASFGLNRMDISQRNGAYPAPAGAPQDILGVEFAGTVEAVGGSGSAGNEEEEEEEEEEEQKKDKWATGDRVFGLIYGGAYAEYVVVDKQVAMRIPDNISFAVAASLPEVWFTAFQALKLNCDIKKGDNVLIHAGASGVGSAAVQLAKAFGAKNVIVTVGSDEKKEYCQGLGATHAFNYKTQDWPKEVESATDGKGVDVLVDFVGATHWNGNLASLALDGRMVMLAFLSGPVIKESNIASILRKRLTIRGSTLRSRDLPYIRDLKNQVEENVFIPWFNGTKTLCSVIDREFSWHNIQEAHRYLESNASMGKIIVNVD
ncbi:quinone oxidoreductase [Obelidium mucronatum]|nr:quinone oxidoreductase [Obelidium mucronatum]